jgi:hypothetical protein
MGAYAINVLSVWLRRHSSDAVPNLCEVSSNIPKPVALLYNRTLADPACSRTSVGTYGLARCGDPLAHNPLSVQLPP